MTILHLEMCSLEGRCVVKQMMPMFGGALECVSIQPRRKNVLFDGVRTHIISSEIVESAQQYN